MAAATRPEQERALIEQQKRLLEARVGRVKEDAREALDWKARLRQDGPRIAAVGGAVVVLVTASVVLRMVIKGRKKNAESAMRERGDLDTLINELHELREELRKRNKGGGGLGGKIAVAAVSAAASAAGKQAADKLIDRQSDPIAA